MAATLLLSITVGKIHCNFDLQVNEILKAEKDVALSQSQSLSKNSK